MFSVPGFGVNLLETVICPVKSDRFARNSHGKKHTEHGSSIQDRKVTVPDRFSSEYYRFPDSSRKIALIRKISEYS
jgi:hypothetical protein